MKKLVSILLALTLGLFVSMSSQTNEISFDTPADVKFVEWALGYGKKCRGYAGKLNPKNWHPAKQFVRRILLAPLMIIMGTAVAEATVMKDVKVLNDGNPMPLGSEGELFTVSPSTAKKCRGYFTDKKVLLTKYEEKMPGVVVGQNRGMLFSSCRSISGDYVIPELKDINLIIVDEKDRKLFPIEDDENKIYWKGNGEHTIKDVLADGQGQHWFCHQDGKLATELWLKVAKFGYGIKGMLQPGLATDIGCKIIDHWNVQRTITKGNTILLNSSLVKGLNAYNSLDELIEHTEMWGLTRLMKQWQSGDHAPERRRIMGTQPNATNLQITKDEISELLKPEARKIWAMKFPRIAWLKTANINTSRGRAFAARPSLMYKDLVMKGIDNKCVNAFLRNEQGKFMAEGQYLKMYMDKLVFSLVYVHGMSINEAAKKAAATGLHGEIRVHPAYARRRFIEDADGNISIIYDKETKVDAKGRYIEIALVRYPHGAPSETIIVKAYLDETVPKDVIMFPAPVANDDGTINVKFLYALRLQGADFDGDAVTAFSEKIWLEAQRRNIGKPYMVIPINTESTEKDKTLLTNDPSKVIIGNPNGPDIVEFTKFFELKVDSLSNEVGLIATSLKYFMSQYAESMRDGENPERDAGIIAEHACAMGDDIDEYKHGKSQNTLVPFIVPEADGKESVLYGPYFNRYACKYKDEESFMKASKTKKGYDKKPGKGTLDMFAKIFEQLMVSAKLWIKPEVEKASDGKDRWFYAVHPVQWEKKDVELFVTGKAEGQKSTALPVELENVFGVEHGTMFTAKELFQLLYRTHSANINALLSNDDDDDEDSDERIKTIHKLAERFMLEKVTIIAWTKAMKMAKDDVDISAEEALKIFTTLLVQHTSRTRSPIDVLTRVGIFTNYEGEKYEKTVFSAKRAYDYFLDLCGDGLFLLNEEKPEFPEVSESILAAVFPEAAKKAAESTTETIESLMAPNMEKARKAIKKQLTTIEKIVALIPCGIEVVNEKVEHAVDNGDDDYDGCWIGPDDGIDQDWIPEYC